MAKSPESLPLAPPTANLGLPVAAAARGDRVAAQEVLIYLLPRIRNLVRYLVRRDNDVDDIAQDALVAILRGLPTYRNEGTFDAWADRIAARTTFAHLRRRRAEPQLSLVDPDSVRDPGLAAASSDDYFLRRRAISVLDTLPLDQRTAFVLHHILELSVSEIAAEMNAPAETIRSRIRLARGRLREYGWSTESARGVS